MAADMRKGTPRSPRMFPMPRPTKATPEEIAAFAQASAGWTVTDGAVRKEFRFSTYPACLAFVQRVGEAAEARDHHPDIHLSWGRVAVTWSTHDAGGITALDFELARRTDELA